MATRPHEHQAWRWIIIYLFPTGGHLGFFGALANTVVEAANGRDMGGNVLALLPGDGETDSDVFAAQAGSDPGPIPGDEAKSALRTANAIVPLVDLARLPLRPGSGAARSNSGPDLQGKSPAAFRTLLRYANGEAPGGKPRRLAALREMPPDYKGSIRDAGLEINRLLRPHAEGRN